MNKRDSNKLLKAGYRFLRIDKHLMAIKIQTSSPVSHGWKVLEKGFATFKAVEKRMEELLKDEKSLEL